MDNKVISLDNLTPENVARLSEGNISDLLNRLIGELPRDRRSQYTDIIRSAFEFRSITPSKQKLKESLEHNGFKFFLIAYNDNLIMGIKRKQSLVEKHITISSFSG